MKSINTGAEKLEVRVRAAPSPTGRVHTGNLRTFLNDYLFAKNTGGEFILRIEDTDQKREVEGGVEAIIGALEQYGIEFDESPIKGGPYAPYLQSKRLDLYREHAEKLVKLGHAYYCFCSEERLAGLREQQMEDKQRPMYDRECRELSIAEAERRIEKGEKYVVRVKFPLTGYMEFEDEIYGKIRINNKEIDDLILLKSDGYPTYHFSVVIDDHFMKITHVFRGREYLTQTSKNMFLYDAFGWKAPKWVHTPHLLNPDGKGKLSKRKGAVPALSYLRKGYLPEAVLNYLVLCGWAPKDKDANQDEIYSVDELVGLFSIERMHKSNARYDQKKLNYINGKHIRNLGVDKLADAVVHWAENYVLKDFIADQFDEHFDWEENLQEEVKEYLPKWKSDPDYFRKCLETIMERLIYLGEIPERINFFYDDALDLDVDDWSSVKEDSDKFADVLSGVWESVKGVVSGGWEHEKWEKAIRDFADTRSWKHGNMFMLLRMAITGRKASPPLFECMEILGVEKCDRFVVQAVKFLENR